MQNKQAHTDVGVTKSGWDSAENLIDGGDGGNPSVLTAERFGE